MSRRRDTRRMNAMPQTAQILNSIRDEQGNPALTVDEIRRAERIDDVSTDTIGALQ